MYFDKYYFAHRNELDAVLDPADYFAYALNHEPLKYISEVWLRTGLQRRDVWELLLAEDTYVFQDERRVLDHILKGTGVTLKWCSLAEATADRRREGTLTYIGRAHGCKT
jgi:hypothetical protein